MDHWTTPLFQSLSSGVWLWFDDNGGRLMMMLLNVQIMNLFNGSSGVWLWIWWQWWDVNNNDDDDDSGGGSAC